MAEEHSNPLLSLIKDQGLIDDLQYEEVLGEFKRTGKPAIQILQDFGIMDIDAILQAISNQIGAPVMTISERDIHLVFKFYRFAVVFVDQRITLF